MSNVPGNHSLRVPALKRLLPVVAVAAAFCVLAMGLPAAANPADSQAQLSAAVSPAAPTVSQAFTSQQQTSWTVNDSPSLYGPSTSWWQVTNSDYSVSAEGYGSHYHYTYSIGGESSPDNWAQWDMGSRVGRQQINVYVPKRNATATVKYRIYKSSGLIAQPTLNQQQAYGWYNLGTYDFDDGTVSIVVNDNEAFPHYDNCSIKAYCKVGVDAIRMKCVSRCTTATFPETPRGLNAVVGGAGELVVRWMPPSGNGGSPLLGYEMTYYIDPDGANNPRTLQLGSGVMSYTLTGLVDDTKYLIGLAAVNSVGTGLGAVTTATTGSTVTAPDRPRNLRVDANDDGSLTVKWTVPESVGGAPVTRYRVSYGNSSTAYRNAYVNATGGNDDIHFDHTITGLDEGTSYSIHVYAINSAGESAAATTNGTTVSSSSGSPGTPTGIQAVAHGERQIRVSWSAPSQSGGSPIKHYRVQYSRPAIGNDRAWTGTATVTGTSHTSGNLRQGVTYTVRVTAVNQDDRASSPASATATTKAASGVPPSSPRNVRAVAHGEKRIRVSWSAPSQSGGSPIKHYRVQYSRPAIGNRPAWSGTATVVGTSNTSGNLLHGVTYTVRVTAVNQSGKSSSPASAKATVDGGARVELTAEDSNRLNTLVNLSTKLQNNVDILNPYQLPQRVDSGYNYFSEAVSIAKRSLKPAGQCCFSWQTGYSETPTRSSAAIAGRVERQLRMIYENYNNVFDRWLTAAISDKQRDINIGRGVIDQSNFNVERWRQVVHDIDRNLIAPISIHLGKTYAPQKNLWFETNSSLSTLFRCLNDVITYNRNRRAPWDTVVHLWRDAFGQTPNCEDAAESLADQLVALAGKIGKEAFNRSAERAEGYIEDRVKQKALSAANRKAVVRKAVNSALAQGAKKLVAAIGAWEGGVELGCVATGLVRILQTARWSSFSQGYGDACGSTAAQWLRPLTWVTEEHLDWTILPRL